MKSFRLTLSVILAASSLFAQETKYERPTAPQILADLAKTCPNHKHPRLLVNEARFEELKSMRKGDAVLNAWCEQLQTKADGLLRQPPVTPQMDPLKASRTVLYNTQTLGLIYRLTGKQAYQERLWAEIKTVCSPQMFPHWGTPGPLDQVEMGTAVAIAYDWLFERWSDEQKRLMRTAIRRNCLEPNLPKMVRDLRSAKRANNVRLVQSAGAATAALAIADEPDVSELAAETIAQALRYAEAPRSGRRLAGEQPLLGLRHKIHCVFHEYASGIHGF